MAAVRSAYTCSKRGITFEAMIQYRMPKAISPMISSAGCGRIGALSGHPTCCSAASRVLAAEKLTGTPWFGGRSGSEDEREHQAEQGQRLGQRESQEGDRLQHAACLGLAGHAIDVGGEDEADTHTGADGRQAEADEVQVAGHVVLVSFRSGARSRVGGLG